MRAEKTLYSETNTDSLSDVPISDKKEKISQKNQECSLNLHVIKRPSDSARNKSNEYFVSNEKLTNPSSDDVEVKIESRESVTCRKISQTSKVCILLQTNSEYINTVMPQVIQSQDTSDDTGEKPVEDNVSSAIGKYEHMQLPTKRQVEELVGIFIILAILLTSVALGIYSMRKMNLNGNFQKLIIWLMVGLLVVGIVIILAILLTIVALVINSMRKMLQNAAAEERSKHKPRKIKLYRNIIENETYRMMMSIDIVVSEAKQLFGLERSQIFFDLLAAKVFHFGSAGAISGFVPNIAESAVRQNVISFFEYSHEMMNHLLKVVSSCPDSKQLQQMPEQNFISLIHPIIESLPETKTKQRKRLSSERNTFTMVDLEEFERELGEDIPEVVLEKLRHGDEVVVHSFVDERELKPQKEETNRPIHSVYFPSDCRLFIYIPTEHGSYWHHLDMQRASRKNQHRK